MVDVPQEKCGYVPTEHCEKVGLDLFSRWKYSLALFVCHCQVPREQCASVPRQLCQSVPVENCQPVERQKCSQVPRKHCQPNTVEHCEPITKAGIHLIHLHSFFCGDFCLDGVFFQDELNDPS